MKEKNFTEQFVLIFRTNISSKKHVKSISRLLNGQTEILKWNIDLSDIDNVLRVEARQPDCRPVIAIVQQAGYVCEELTD